MAIIGVEKKTHAIESLQEKKMAMDLCVVRLKSSEAPPPPAGGPGSTPAPVKGRDPLTASARVPEAGRRTARGTTVGSASPTTSSCGHTGHP